MPHAGRRQERAFAQFEVAYAEVLKARRVAAARARLAFVNARPPESFAGEMVTGGMATEDPFDPVLTPWQHALLSPALGQFLDAVD